MPTYMVKITHCLTKLNLQKIKYKEFEHLKLRNQESYGLTTQVKNLSAHCLDSKMYEVEMNEINQDGSAEFLAKSRVGINRSLSLGNVYRQYLSTLNLIFLAIWLTFIVIQFSMELGWLSNLIVIDGVDLLSAYKNQTLRLNYTDPTCLYRHEDNWGYQYKNNSDTFKIVALFGALGEWLWLIVFALFMCSFYFDLGPREF